MKNTGETGISRAFGERALFCRYRCERCGHDSQWRKVDVISLFLDTKAKLQAQLARRYFQDLEEKEAAYYTAAQEAVGPAFAAVQQQVEHDYFGQLLYREKGCPVCGAKQSWMDKLAKPDQLRSRPRLWADPVIDGKVMLSDFVDPAEQEELPTPCQVEIRRLPRFLSSIDSVCLALNGVSIGGLHERTAITVETHLRHNILALHSVLGGPVFAAVSFEAAPGGTVVQQFAGSKFKPAPGRGPQQIN